MLEQLKRNVNSYQPEQRIQANYPDAAVLLPITCEEDPKLVFTRRAGHMNTHSGQVAFPGGKRDPEDEDLKTTALREAQEEVGLDPNQVELLGPLGEWISLHGIRVTPYVGLIPSQLELCPCEAELDAIFQVPVRWFLDDPRSHTDEIQVAEQRFYVPSYQWQEYRIWGLSAMMLVELLQVGFNMNISLDSKPAGKTIKWPVRPFPPR